jgi:hypothetical protein
MFVLLVAYAVLRVAQSLLHMQHNLARATNSLLVLNGNCPSFLEDRTFRHQRKIQVSARETVNNSFTILYQNVRLLCLPRFGRKVNSLVGPIVIG